MLVPYTLDLADRFRTFRLSVPPTPYVKAFSESPDPDRLLAEFYSRVYDRPQNVPGSKRVLAILDEEDAIVGEIHLIYGNTRNRTYYISWIISPEYQGMGYAREHIALALEQCFSAGVHRVVASIEPDNVASKAVAQKVGFRQEGTAVQSLFRDDTWHDVEYWAITEDDVLS